jgi:hypothetical protein
MTTDLARMPATRRRRSPIRIDLELMQLEAAVDATRRATPATWERRAELWDWATPRPDDFNGRATAVDLADRTRRCQARAAACRRHAALLRSHPDEVTC